MAFAHLTKEVLVEVLAERSIKSREVADVIVEEGSNWMTPIRDYLIIGIILEDLKLARKVRIKAPQYRLIGDHLYRRYFLSPWLRCVRPKQASNIIFKVHEVSCSLHAGPQSIVSKIVKLGYYWPSMHRDAMDIIHKCEACQIHSKVPRLPKQEMTSVTSAWPFS
jgi:hypothetical protein